MPHSLIGATALAVMGVARSTCDIDLLTCDRHVLAPAFWLTLRSERLTVDCRPGDADDPLAGVVRIEEVDERPVVLIVGRHAWQVRCIERSTRHDEGPRVVSPGDPILLKLDAGGAQDPWDIRELLATPGGAQIAADVERDLASLPAGMQQRWASLR